MRICKNGFIREMSLDEIEEFESKKEDEESHEMTPEERLSIMEDAFAELCEVIFNG